MVLPYRAAKEQKWDFVSYLTAPLLSVPSRSTVDALAAAAPDADVEDAIARDPTPRVEATPRNGAAPSLSDLSRGSVGSLAAATPDGDADVEDAIARDPTPRVEAVPQQRGRALAQ
jgi:hypothetical protein